MFGILVQLALSWAIVWFVAKENLGVLGLRPTRRRLFDFALYFVVTGALCASGFILKMLIAKQQWQLNPAFQLEPVLTAIWYAIKSTLFEELIFRGVLLYLLIRKLGNMKGITISGIAFGIYHWFSHNLFGNVPAMVIEFFITGIMGLILAYGYTQSKSLYIPTAIHLGWGIVQMIVFSGGTVGNQIFTEVLPRAVVTISYFSYFFMELFSLVSVYAVNFWLLWRRKQEQILSCPTFPGNR
jgi:uncharacterized protein